MKKILIIGVFVIIVLLIVIHVLFLRRTPFKIAENFTGYKIPKTLSIVVFKDEWNQNGDGESFIIFNVSLNELQNIEKKCIQMKYSKLPIKENLPDNFIYNHIKKTDTLGYYSLNIEKKDSRNYSIVILNLKEHKLIVYNVIN